jgi:heterodisulfide reductase subunit C
MGQVDGFMKFDREMPQSRDKRERLKDYKEVYTPLSKEKVHEQSARCMDCGVPFCHNGCPLGITSRISTMRFIRASGRRRSKFLVAQIIFLSSPEEFVRHRVKQAVC